MKVNVGTIGHIDHGKTTLTQALVTVIMAGTHEVTGTKNSITSKLNETCDTSPYPWRRKDKKRKTVWKAKLKAAQLKAFEGKK